MNNEKFTELNENELTSIDGGVATGFIIIVGVGVGCFLVGVYNGMNK